MALLTQAGPGLHLAYRSNLVADLIRGRVVAPMAATAVTRGAIYVKWVKSGFGWFGDWWVIYTG